MTTFFAISQKELDYDAEVKAQLDSIAQQTEHIDDEYFFLPQEEYTDTFVWVLQSNHIPYRLCKSMAQ
jgi:hypothetical protein